MPSYPWLFDGAADKPNKRGLALLTYVQWLGSWLESYPYYEDYDQSPIAKLEKLAQSQDSNSETATEEEAE